MIASFDFGGYFYSELNIPFDKRQSYLDNPRLIFGGVAEWLKASDCKSDLLEYEGSNPSPSTKFCMASFD